MAPSTSDRLNALLGSGEGFSLETIAAILGLDIADVAAYTANPSYALPAAGGGSGSAVVSACATVAAGTITLTGGDGSGRDAPSLIAFDGFAYDTIGCQIVSDVEPGAIMLPAGFYMATAVIDEVMGVGALGATPYDVYEAKLTLGCGGYDPGPAIRQAGAGYSYEPTGADSSGKAMSTTAAFESGSVDLGTFGFTESGFALASATLGARDLATGAAVSGDIVLTNPRLYIQKLG
jgi:hypothetical protein